VRHGGSCVLTAGRTVARRPDRSASGHAATRPPMLLHRSALSWLRQNAEPLFGLILTHRRTDVGDAMGCERLVELADGRPAGGGWRVKSPKIPRRLDRPLGTRRTTPCPRTFRPVVRSHEAGQPLPDLLTIASSSHGAEELVDPTPNLAASCSNDRSAKPSSENHRPTSGRWSVQIPPGPDDACAPGSGSAMR
jgi:hypothetical protein